jgi:hypothetical protein
MSSLLKRSQKMAIVWSEQGGNIQMEIGLFKRDGLIYTRFKVRVREKDNWLLYLSVKYGVDISKPVKENSRYLYFEKSGDWLNVAKAS